MKDDSIIQELKEQLKFKDFELNAILEITKGINTNQSVDYLISVFELILKEQLGLDKFVLFSKQNNWDYLIKSGVKGKIKDVSIERDLIRLRETTLIDSSSNTELNQFDVVIPVIHQ